MVETALAPTPPLTVPAGRYGRNVPVPGLSVRVVGPRAMVQIMARRNQAAALGRILRSQYGVALPDRPTLAPGDRVSLLWSGHDQWLALARDDSMPNLKAELQLAVAATASLSDQSDARFALVLSGPLVRETLAKVTLIDFHPRTFRPLQTVLTLFGHLNGQITQTDDTPSYEVMVFRGFAESLWRSAHMAGAEYGIDVIETGLPADR
jgi:heterotetrameric sarcosine oxidase gamma subunit